MLSQVPGGKIEMLLQGSACDPDESCDPNPDLLNFRLKPSTASADAPVPQIETAAAHLPACHDAQRLLVHSPALPEPAFDQPRHHDRGLAGAAGLKGRRGHGAELDVELDGPLVGPVRVRGLQYRRDDGHHAGAVAQGDRCTSGVQGELKDSGKGKGW